MNLQNHGQTRAYMIMYMNMGMIMIMIMSMIMRVGERKIIARSRARARECQAGAVSWRGKRRPPAVMPDEWLEAIAMNHFDCRSFPAGILRSCFLYSLGGMPKCALQYFPKNEMLGNSSMSAISLTDLLVLFSQ